MDFDLEPQKGSRQQVPDLYVADQAPIRGGGEGGPANPDFSVPPLQPVRSNTLGGLVAIAGKLLAPAIKRSEEQQFFEGMARAAAGEAAAEIAKERPDWANFFGEGAAVAGARAYEGQRDAIEFETGLLEQMKDHRALPPLQYAEALRTAVQKRSTGDPVRDQQLQATALRAMPALMKLHAKEHLAFNQENAWRARGGAMTAAFDQLHSWYNASRTKVAAALGDGEEVPVSQPDLERARSQFLSVFTPFDGERIELRDRQILERAKEAIGKGNFDALHVLKDVGIWEQLDSSVRDTLQAEYERTGRRELPNRVSWKLLDQFAAFINNPGADGEKIDETIIAFNKLATAQSGIEIDFFPPETGLRLRQAGMQDAAQAAKAAAKTAQSAQVNGMALRMLTDPRVMKGEIEPGSSARMRVLDGYSEAEKVQAEVAWAQTSKLTDPVQIGAARATILLNYGTAGRKLDAAESWIQAGLTGDTPSQAGLAIVAAMNQVPESGRPTLEAYLSREQQFFVSEFRMALRNPDFTQVDAWKYARASARQAELTANLSKLEKSDVAIVDRAVSDFRDKTFGFGGKDVNPLGLGLLRTVIAKHLKESVGGGSDSHRGSVALAKALQTFRFEGEIGYLPMRDDVPSVHQRIGGSPSEAAAALKAVWEKKTGAAAKPETLSALFASTDPDGALVFQSHYVDTSGVARIIPVRINERELIEARRGITAKKRGLSEPALEGAVEPWQVTPN